MYGNLAKQLFLNRYSNTEQSLFSYIDEVKCFNIIVLMQENVSVFDNTKTLTIFF